MKILVPVDGSKHAWEGLRVAAGFVKMHKAAAYLITVIPSVADIDLELSASERDNLLESMKRMGESLLAKSVDQLRQYGVEAATTVLAAAVSPEAEIIAFAEKERIDVIVIGSRGRNAHSRFHIGSTAANVVRHSPCCVYVVKDTCWKQE